MKQCECGPRHSKVSGEDAGEHDCCCDESFVTEWGISDSVWREGRKRRESAGE